MYLIRTIFCTLVVVCTNQCCIEGKECRNLNDEENILLCSSITCFEPKDLKGSSTLTISKGRDHKDEIYN